MKLIGFNGPARVGKDTLADVLVKYHNFTKVAFADPLKNIISKAFNVPLDELYTETKDNPYDEPLNLSEGHITALASEINTYIELDMDVSELYEEHSAKSFESHRDIMQYVGTEIFRSIDPDIWIKVFKNQVLKYDKVACPDVRMPNERKLIKELGGVLVLIKRPKYEARDHASEADMGVEDEYDVIVNNNMKKTGVEQEFRFWYEYVYSDGDPR